MTGPLQELESTGVGLLAGAGVAVLLGVKVGVDAMVWVALTVGIPAEIDVGVDDWTAVAGWVRDGGSVAPEVEIGPWGVSVNSNGGVVGVAVNDEI